LSFKDNRTLPLDKAAEPNEQLNSFSAIHTSHHADLPFFLFVLVVQQFLKSLATFSGDLSSMTAPSFILSPVSLTEYPS